MKIDIFNVPVVGSSRCGSVLTNLTSIHEDTGSFPGLTHWLRIPGCHELWCCSQLQHGSRIAVAGSYSSDSTLSLGTSTCHKCGPKKTNNKYIFKKPAFVIVSSVAFK